jgi:hypothetical protein
LAGSATKTRLAGGVASQTIGVVDGQAVALDRERPGRAAQRLGGGPLQPCCRAFVELQPHEVVTAGIADVEADARIHARQIDEVGRQEIARLPWRRRGQGAGPQGPGIGADRTTDARLDFGAKVPPRQEDAVQAHASGGRQQLAAALHVVAARGVQPEPPGRPVMGEDGQRAVVGLEDRQRRFRRAVLGHQRQVGRRQGRARRHARGQDAGGDGSTGLPHRRRPVPYFMVGMTKALSSTSPSGQRAVTVLTLV